MESVGADHARLNALGRKGWELVGVVPGEPAPTFCFRRPVPDFRERVTNEQKPRFVDRQNGL